MKQDWESCSREGWHYLAEVARDCWTAAQQGNIGKEEGAGIPCMYTTSASVRYKYLATDRQTRTRSYVDYLIIRRLEIEVWSDTWRVYGGRTTFRAVKWRTGVGWKSLRTRLDSGNCDCVSTWRGPKKKVTLRRNDFLVMEGRRPAGRPKKAWEDFIRGDIPESAAG